MSLEYDELIKTYIENRELKSRLKREYEAKVKEIDEFQSLIESYFADEASRTKLLNFKTPFGVAYKYRHASVRTEDKAEFTGFIIENRQWGLLDARPVKKSCLSWLDDCGFAPPGLKIERFDKIGVRAPGEKTTEEE